MDVFKSKIDKWLLACLVFSIIACLMGASVMLKVGGSINYVIAVFMITAGAGFPLWILVSTKYIVRNENLKILSGPFSWDIPVKSIKSVQETKSAITSPALSFDRLEITYDGDKSILVSPDDKEAFMKQIEREKLADDGDDVPQHTTTGKNVQNNTKKNKKGRKKV